MNIQETTIQKNIAEKVRAYIFRKSTNENYEVLVFNQPEFPEGGVQVPGGTVDPGESLIEALKREIYEETGFLLNDGWEKVAQEIITHPVNGDQQIENIYLLIINNQLPNQWQHLVSGDGEDNGILFNYYWLPLSKAKLDLFDWMADQLGLCINFNKEI